MSALPATTGRPDAMGVRQLLLAAVRAGQAPGAVAVWGPSADSLQDVTVGRAAVVPSSGPLTAEHWFDLASLTKPLVTTTLALIVMRRGGLSTETTVGEVLTELIDAPAAVATVLQLLTHTSGLPGWAPLYSRGGGIEAVVDTIGRLQLVADPGRRVVYSCPGFILLGLMVERVAGAGLDQLLTDLVVEPLDLRDDLGFAKAARDRPVVAGALTPGAETALLAERGLRQDLIPPRWRHQPDDGNARALGDVAGNAGLLGSARGVARLALQYLPGHGELLRPDEVRLATGNLTPGKEQDRGFGWQLASSPGCSAGPALSSGSFGHTGFTGTSVWIDPSVPQVMVLLCHRHHPAHRGTDLHPLRRRFHALTLKGRRA